MTNQDLKNEMGEKRYNQACERLNDTKNEAYAERWAGGKKTFFKKSVADRLDYKGKVEKPKTIFIMSRGKK